MVRCEQKHRCRVLLRCWVTPMTINHRDGVWACVPLEQGECREGLGGTGEDFCQAVSVGQSRDCSQAVGQSTGSGDKIKAEGARPAPQTVGWRPGPSRMAWVDTSHGVPFAVILGTSLSLYPPTPLTPMFRSCWHFTEIFLNCAVVCTLPPPPPVW